MFENPYYNPYFQMPQAPAPQIQPQKQEVTKVNGENGARAYSIGPNSSALLLDSSGLLVWLVTTDGAGYKSVAPYDISPHQEAPAPDFSTLEQRISRLEGIFNEYSSDSTTARTESAAPAGKKRHRFFQKLTESSGGDAAADYSEESSDDASY
jgi:hypothetical protein